MDGVKSRYNAGSIVGTLIESSIRFFQFVFAIAVIGLYGQDVDKARKTGFSQDARWVCHVPTIQSASFPVSHLLDTMQAINPS